MVVIMQLLEKIAALDNNPKAYIESHLSKVDSNMTVLTLEQAQEVLLLGRAYLLTGRHDISVNLLNKALSFLVVHGDKMSLFQCYNNLGIVYREEKQYDLALKVLNKAYNISFDLEDFSFVILSLVNIASIYSSMDNIDKAFELLNKALQYKDRLKNSKILGDLYNNYAFVLMGEGKYPEALHFFSEAYEVYKRLYGEVIPTNIVIVLSNIGETYVLMKDYVNAMPYLLRALKHAEEGQIKFVELDCHLNLSKVYEATGDFKTALYHHKKFSDIHQEISNEQIVEQIEELHKKYENETKKSEEEINLLRNVELKSKTNELEKTLKNLATISQIGQRLTSSMDMNQIYEILRSSIYALMNVDVFGLALFDAKAQKIIYKYFEEGGKSLPLLEIELNNSVSLAAYCILNEEDIFVKSFDDEYKHYLTDLSYTSIGNNKAKSTKCIVYCRLISEEGCIGLITMQSYVAYEYTEVDFEVIKALASYVAIAISNAQKKNIIIEKAQELEYLSYNDPLTELFNRRYFNRMADHLDASEASLPLGLIIGDMNDLKEVNDQFGHQLGDQYLIEIAKIMKSVAGELPVFRLGGDEFAILMKNATDQKLSDMCEHIAIACEQVKIGSRPLSIAVGYEIKNSMETNIDEIFALAESKMYKMKNAAKVNKK